MSPRSVADGGHHADELQPIASSERSLNSESLQVYPRRWLLGLLAALTNFISAWVCFSSVPIEASATVVYKNLSPSTVVAWSLGINTLCTVLEPWAVDKFGMRKVLIAASGCMLAGNLLKSGVPYWFDLTSTPLYTLGVAIIGATQPFFQCTVAPIVTNWFPVSERGVAMAFALNANFLGIAAAYVGGTSIVKGPADVLWYYNGLTWIAALTFVGIFACFDDQPPTPPSHSAQAEERLEDGLERGPFWKPWLALFRQEGFWLCLAVFCCSVTIANVLATFLGSILLFKGCSPAVVGWTGAAFQFSIMVGSLVMGAINDRLHMYYGMTLLMLALSAGFLTMASVSVNMAGVAAIATGFCLLGFFVGPLKPLMTELGVEVTFPSHPNDVIFVETVLSNALSTAGVPVFRSMKSLTPTPYISSMYLLLAILVAVGVLFATQFRGEYKRLRMDMAIKEHAAQSIPVIDGLRQTQADPVRKDLV